MRDAQLAPLILLVDDAESDRALYAEYFEHAGLRVAQAVDGDHALWKVVSLKPDVVVMDLTMPVLDGWEATRKMKAHPRTMHIPVIVLTGHATEAELRRADDAGANVVLTKPCAPEALVVVVRGLLAR